MGSPPPQSLLQLRAALVTSSTNISAGKLSPPVSFQFFLKWVVRAVCWVHVPAHCAPAGQLGHRALLCMVCCGFEMKTRLVPRPESPHTPQSQDFHCSDGWAELPPSSLEGNMRARMKPRGPESTQDLGGHPRNPKNHLSPEGTSFPSRGWDLWQVFMDVTAPDKRGWKGTGTGFSCCVSMGMQKGTAQRCSHRAHKSLPKHFLLPFLLRFWALNPMEQRDMA